MPSFLESLQPNEPIYGYHLMRLIDGLQGRRDPNLAVIQVPSNAPSTGGIQIDGKNLSFFADGTTPGLPAGTLTLNTNINGQFQSANNWPLCWGYQPVDGTYKTRNRFWLTSDVQRIYKVYLAFSCQPFHVGNQTTAAATTATTASSTSTVSSSTSQGGSAHSHSISGQSTSTTSSDAQPPNNYDATHFHHVSGTVTDNMLGLIPIQHTHSIPAASVSGGTSTNESSHTHNVPGQTINIPSVNVNIPSLSLNAPTAIYESGMAQGCHVFIDGVDQTTALGGPFGAGSASDFGPLDVTPFITNTGWHEINISSTTIGGVTVTIYTKTIITAI